MGNIPGQSEIYASLKAYNLGFLDGRNAMESGAPVRFQPRRDPSWSRMCDDEYQRGWDEALAAYGTSPEGATTEERPS